MALNVAFRYISISCVNFFSCKQNDDKSRKFWVVHWINNLICWSVCWSVCFFPCRRSDLYCALLTIPKIRHYQRLLKQKSRRSSDYFSLVSMMRVRPANAWGSEINDNGKVGLGRRDGSSWISKWRLACCMIYVKRKVYIYGGFLFGQFALLCLSIFIHTSLLLFANTK